MKHKLTKNVGQYYKSAIIPGPVAPVQCLAGDCRLMLSSVTRDTRTHYSAPAPAEAEIKPIVTVTASYEYNITPR